MPACLHKELHGCVTERKEEWVSCFVLNVNKAEVQSVYNDGSLSLHTRSLKYGKVSQDSCDVSRLVSQGFFFIFNPFTSDSTTTTTNS